MFSLVKILNLINITNPDFVDYQFELIVIEFPKIFSLLFSK